MDQFNLRGIYSDELDDRVGPEPTYIVTYGWEDASGSIFCKAIRGNFMFNFQLTKVTSWIRGLSSLIDLQGPPVRISWGRVNYQMPDDYSERTTGEVSSLG